MSVAQLPPLEGDLAPGTLRFACVAARFNDFVVEPLVQGAVDTLRRHGVADSRIQIVRVPGAFEIPLVVRKLALSGDYDAVIALGAVIRGDTPHFDYVAGECARGLSLAALESGRPVAFGVLTRHRRAGDRSCRRQGWQQGGGCCSDSARDGESAAAPGFVKP